MIGKTPGSRLYRIWKGMRQRCYSPSHPGYVFYGARGVAICDEWRTFVGFLDWALTNGYAENLQIDRVDADGWYEPGNCRWIPVDLNVSRQELDRSGKYLPGLRGKLSDDTAERASPRDRPYKLADGHGLFLLVRPSGTKSWQYAFRFERKHQLLSLGPFPNRNTHAARELHAVARSRLKRGVNPA